ncbi:hypothetical protein CWI36_0244p0020 [Hamiltosporidium magnivora]|uniref:Uncharacterized protein n=1 Tax=Hamiltosporidium magnivora TaxID=148818 RepID=A0A4Q9LHP3_9MICR|nr:hypothetical protein CWI36_0244p0020 [Hamiltosporidium magnivora]
MKFGKRYSHINFFYFSFGFYILFFVYYSSERDIVFNVLKDNKDIYSNSIATETECLCQIKRGSILDTKVIDCFKEMLFRNENMQYNQYVIKDTAKFSHSFEPFEKLKDMNSNIEIFLCQHIKDINLFILILNTLDIKYVHISELNETNVTDYCLVLKNIKKKVEEILFFKVYIFSEIIRCIDANLNFINIKKIVFIRSKIENYLILLDYLKKMSEFIFFEETRPSKINIVAQINDLENLKLIKEIEINMLQHGYQEYSLKKLVPYLKIMPLKFKLLEVVNIASKYWQIECYFDYKDIFYNISITLTNLDFIKENIKKLRIADSKITSNFIADILNINKLKSQKIKNCDISFKDDDIEIRNKSIKYFCFRSKNHDDFGYFYQFVNFMTEVKDVYFTFSSTLKFNPSETQIFYIKELNIENIQRLFIWVDFQGHI